MSKHVMTLLMMAILTVVSACSVISQRLTMDAELLLLSPAEGPQPGLLKQKVSLLRHQNTHTFIVLNKISRQELKVLVLLPTGQTFLEMQYDGRHFSHTNKMNIGLPEQEIMALMQFTLWPIEIIQQYYSDSAGWQFSSNDNYRELKLKQQPYLLMTKQENSIKIEHFKHNYQVMIQPLESDKVE